MKKLLFFVCILFTGVLSAQVTDSIPDLKTSVIVTKDTTIVITSVDDLLYKSRELYDKADNMLGQIDSVFVKKILVIVSWDSAGIRKRVVTYVDTFSVDLFK